MVNIFLTPRWIFGYDILLELAFALVTLFVRIYAFKVYRLTMQKQLKLFGIAFMFISISYFIQSYTNFAIISEIGENAGKILDTIEIGTLNSIGLYAHMLFFITGLVTLAYMSMRIDSIKTYTLLIILTIASLLFNPYLLYMFYILSSVLLVYIVAYYLFNYLKKRQHNTLLVLIAFVFLLFGSIHFSFSVNHSLYYAIAHILGLVAYMLILINLIRVIRK